MDLTNRLELEKLSIDDRALVMDLLQKAGLPVSDIDLQKQLFIKALCENKAVGIGALEIVENYGLIRSVVVQDIYRGKGAGIQIINALIAEARERGLKQLFLLTETAEQFFSKLDFRKVERNTAPKSIAELPEFTSICPSSAVCMSYELK